MHGYSILYSSESNLGTIYSNVDVTRVSVTQRLGLRETTARRVTAAAAAAAARQTLTVAVPPLKAATLALTITTLTTSVRKRSLI